jgi:hypothetical protein
MPKTRIPAAERKAAEKAAAEAAKAEPLPRLTFEAIEQAPDLKEKEVDVPEWGGSVLVRGVSKAIWEKYTEMETPEDICFLMSEAIVEPAVTAEQAAAMRAKSITAVGRVEGAILEVCGLGSAVADAERRFLASSAD